MDINDSLMSAIKQTTEILIKFSYTVLDLSTFENGHADLWAYLDERIPMTSYPQYDIVNYLRDKGWIRANTKEQYIETEQISTEKQALKIAEILKLYPISVKINL